MKVGEFQKAIGCNANSYRNFMGQNGPDKGAGSSVYPNAFAFFKKRKLMGKKIPKKKVKKEDEEKQHDMTGIHLDGESDGEVPVYDTCDEVRRKIRAHLTQPSVTQASFLHAIAQTHPEGKKFQSKSLSDFLGKSGPTSGNTSGVFYASDVYFEKMRIKEKKPKSKHREEMEKIYSRVNPYSNGGRPGFDTTIPSSRGILCPAGERPHIDQYGRVSFH